MGQSSGSFRRLTNSTVGVEPVSKCRAITCLLVLFGVYVLNQANRQVLPVLIPSGLRCYYNGTKECDPGDLIDPSLTLSASLISPNQLTEELCDPGDCVEFTDTQQGVLIGPSITIVYTIVGIPISRFTDNNSRVIPLAVGLLIWTGMVCLTAFAESYWMLLVAQVVIGIGEATCNPAAFALIADYFKTINRAKALSFYYFAVYLGGSLGYALGAVNMVLCWRWTLLLIAMAGAFMLVLVIMLLRSPDIDEDGLGYKNDNYFTIKETAIELVSCKPYVVLCLAAAVRNIAGLALGAWLATFYAKYFMESSREYGLKIALIVLLGGGASSVIGGYCSDRFSLENKQAKAFIIAVSQLVAAPCIIATLLVQSIPASYGLLFLSYLTAETWLGPAAAIIQDLFSPSLRAQASAVYIALITLAGGGLGPLLIPAILELNPAWTDCNIGVGYALAIVVPTCYVVAAILFLVVGHFMRNEPLILSSETMYLTYDTSDREGDTTSEKSYMSLDHMSLGKRSSGHISDGNISEAL